jgi:hypothetical protein
MSTYTTRQCAFDYMLTLPPVKDWSAETLRAAIEVFTRIAGRQRELANPAQPSTAAQTRVSCAQS